MLVKQSSSFTKDTGLFPDLWPPNSPDLNPADYRIWGLMQKRAYKTPVHDTSDLKQCLIGVTISQSIIDEAVGQWRKWLRASVEAKGHRVISVKLKPALFRATDSLLRKTLYFASVLL